MSHIFFLFMAWDRCEVSIAYPLVTLISEVGNCDIYTCSNEQ